MLKYLLLIFSLSVSNYMHSQTLHPEITNYSFGSSQNWSIDVDADQIISVANNSGLSRFNGQSWSMHQLPKKMIVRSVLSVDGLIYTGSYEEFGYWKKNESGELVYHSLRSKFPENSPQQSEEFWQIIKFKDSIFFRSFGAIYSFDGESISLITNSQDVSSLCVYEDRLLFSNLTNGIFEIDGNEAKPYLESVDLIGLKSVSILSSFKNLLFTYDTRNGAYLTRGKESIRLSPLLNIALKDYTLNKVAFIDASTMAFGTIKNGVIIYNIDKQQFNVLNRQSGIRNNTVLDLKVHQDYLWLALDNGVSRIDIMSEFTYFNDASGSLGTVYDVAFFNGKYYLASNTGVYTFYNNDLTLIENSEGHCWGIVNQNGKLFFGHNRGAFMLQNEKLVAVEGSFSGVYNYIPIPNSDDLLVSTYSGIGVLNNTNGDYSISKLVGLDVPVDQLIFENDSTLWATDNYKGLFKLKFDPVQQKVLNIDRLSDNRSIAGKEVEIQALNNNLFFKIEDNWFTYSNRSNIFKPYKGFENKTVINSDKDGFWLLDRESSSIINYNDSFEIQKEFTNDDLVSKLVNGYERIIFKDRSTGIFNLTDGFAVLNLQKSVAKKVEKPVIENVSSNDQRLDFSNENTLKLNNSQARSVSFDVFTPGGFDNQLYYQLEGEINQTEPITDGRFTLQNLPTGDYVIHVFEKGSNNTATTIELKILPPWYLSWIMKVIYLLLIAAAIYAAGKYQKVKAEKAHLKTQQRLEEEARRKILLVEKNNLINEINTRKQELTNRTATIVKKNEAIISLRNELRKLQEISPNVTRTRNILDRSGEQLDSKNDWKLFETKFNELNEDFFERLSKEFPKLTTKDRKLCAYIKIGLTSKEIAPLLGITKRSVELQRYRLRKKLKLDAGINFNEFLRLF